MQIQFAATVPAGTQIVARVVNQDSLPADLEATLAHGARAARFTGKAGQVFDGFAERNGEIVRVAIAGAGDKGDEGRLANLEKAGGALAAKFACSGSDTIAVELEGLTDEEAAAVLMGLRLRTWRHDRYRTRMKDEQKVTLKKAVGIGGSAGVEAAWRDAEAVAEGIEFTRELVAEPANIIYPESFVARCRERYEGTGLEITVLGVEEMTKLGMGALLGVGQGSEQPSRLLAVKWNGGEAGGRLGGDGGAHRRRAGCGAGGRQPRHQRGLHPRGLRAIGLGHYGNVAHGGGLRGQRAVVEQPLRPVGVAHAQRLADQQGAEAGAVDEQVALDDLPILQHQ